MSIVSAETLAIIKATAPLVKDNSEKITSNFYPKMLGKHPELYRYFNESNQKAGTQTRAFGAMASGQQGGLGKSNSQQSKTLADAIVAYAMNIEQLENLSEAVGRICHKHAALGIQPSDYQIVHDNLMESIGEVLGDAVTAEIAAAWSEAVMALAKLLIQTETDLYKTASEEQWTGVREFQISEIIDEAESIKSIRLKAKDGKGTCPFEPGQYISVYEKPDGREYFAPRHYTVTSQPGDNYYQISPKKMVNGEHEGFMSHYLHSKKVGDTVKLGPVFGPSPLRLADDTSRVAVFVSIGVGITPTIAMLPTAIATMKRVAVFHGDHDSETMAFQSRLEDIIPKSDGILDISFSARKRKAEDSVPKFVSEGRLTGAKIVSVLSAEKIEYKKRADFFICAGNTETQKISKGLRAVGVSTDRIHLEFFGPFQQSLDE